MKKWSYFEKKSAFGACFLRWKSFLWQLIWHILFYILSICCKFVLFQSLYRGIRMYTSILSWVQNERASKNAKITHILSIEVFQAASDCFFRNITKKQLFRFCLFFFLHVSEMQVLKSRQIKTRMKVFMNQKFRGLDWLVFLSFCSFSLICNF